ncbi:MAG: hypothetical protein ACK51N_00180 [bacterium]
MPSLRTLLAGGLAFAGLALGLWPAPSPALAWDAPGHRMITWLALDGLDASAPAFLRETAVRDAIAWQAAEPDRWRGLRNPYISNATYGNHFIDIEDLEPLGLTIDTMSPLRYRYVRDMAIGRHEHPAGLDGKSKPYNAKLDPMGQQEWAGFLLHAICEHQAILTSQFKTYRILEKLNEPDRAAQLQMSRANIMATMGVLSHYVGDGAQPLHTTRHFNGWVGDNPGGYTTAKTFHAYIDGGVIAHHKLNYHVLKPGQTYARTAGRDPWNDVLGYVKASFEKVEPLYAMEKKGELTQDAGKTFITERLHDGAAMLAAMYNAAWAASEPSPQDLADFIKYDGFNPAEAPSAAPAPASAPATVTPPANPSPR